MNLILLCCVSVCSLKIFGHQPVIFAAISGLLSIDATEAQRLYAFAAGRDMISAAIRLGIVGPTMAQAQLHALPAICGTGFQSCCGAWIGDAWRQVFHCLICGRECMVDCIQNCFTVEENMHGAQFLSHSHLSAGHHHHHEVMEHPGRFTDRDKPLARDFTERAFTVGIGGPVGSGKTALTWALCRSLRDSMSLGVVTNDIFTREDAEFLTRNEALPAERIRAVETGGCPHAAIREDVSANVLALEELSAR